MGDIGSLILTFVAGRLGNIGLCPGCEDCAEDSARPKQRSAGFS